MVDKENVFRSMLSIVDMEDFSNKELLNSVARQLLDWNFEGYVANAHIKENGSWLYRARRMPWAECNTLSDIGAPPPEYANSGRANTTGQSVFYACDAYEPLFYELGQVAEGDEFVVSSWKVNKPMIISEIGRVLEVYQSLGSNPQNLPKATSLSDMDRIIRLGVGLLFTHSTDYEVTNKISNRHLGSFADNSEIESTLGLSEGELSEMHGISYPTVRMRGMGHNYALNIESARRNLELISLRSYKIQSVDENIKYSIQCTAERDSSGKFIWKSGSHNFVLTGDHKEAIITAVAGEDEFGWYIRGKEGDKVHWSAMLGNGKFLRPVITPENSGV